jgi:hypothetical protein
LTPGQICNRHQTPAVPVAKFAAGVIDTGSKFATMVLLTLVANLPLVSLISVVHLHLLILSQIFEEI